MYKHISVSFRLILCDKHPNFRFSQENCSEGATPCRYVKGSFTRTIKVTIFVPFKNGFNAVLWCCLHITLETNDIDMDGTCKRTLNISCLVFRKIYHSSVYCSTTGMGYLLSEVPLLDHHYGTGIHQRVKLEIQTPN